MNRTYFPFLFLIVSLNGFSQGDTHQNKQSRSPFLFDKENLDRNSKELAAIYAVMADYYEGVEKANLTLLEKVFHPDWFMRDTETPNEATLNVESKQKFIKRVNDHGPYPGYGQHRNFATVGLTNENMAFVRINKSGATSFILFKLDNEWIIMDKMWATMNPENSAWDISEYAKVQELLYSYFEAVKNSNVQKLDDLLHKAWDKKSVNYQNDYSVSKRGNWLKNIPANSYPDDPTKLVSIDLYNGKLAIIRVDFTKESTATFFICFKTNDTWKIAGERTSSSVNERTKLN